MLNMGFFDACRYVQHEKYVIELRIIGVDSVNAQDLVKIVIDRAKSSPHSVDYIYSTVKWSLAKGLSLVDTVDKLNKDFPA